MYRYIVDGFSAFNDIFLKMNWLSETIEYLFINLLHLPDSNLTHIAVYFTYDVIKILILLVTLIYSISWVQSYFPPERTRKILGKYNGFSAHAIAALLGTITPFCSCSSIPLFIGFTASGLPVGVTFSFLISSPLVDMASIILLASIFNFRIAFAYVVVGLILAISGGYVMSVFKMDRYVEDFAKNRRAMPNLEIEMTKRDRHDFAWAQVKDIVQKVFIYILIGVGIGAAIHNVIPLDWIMSVLGPNHWYSVVLATLLGVPIYADIFGTLPIAQALLEVGVGLGTVLALMMAVTTLSLPSMILLKKVVKMPLLVLFAVYCTIGIMIIGFVFNNIQMFLL